MIPVKSGSDQPIKTMLEVIVLIKQTLSRFTQALGVSAPEVSFKEPRPAARFSANQALRPRPPRNTGLPPDNEPELEPLVKVTGFRPRKPA